MNQIFTSSQQARQAVKSIVVIDILYVKNLDVRSAIFIFLLHSNLASHISQFVDERAERFHPGRLFDPLFKGERPIQRGGVMFFHLKDDLFQIIDAKSRIGKDDLVSLKELDLILNLISGTGHLLG